LRGKTNKTSYISILVVVLGILTLFGWGAGSVSATSHIQVQLYTLEENSVRVNDFPFGKKYVIAIVSETEDLTKLLPITLTVRHARVTATDRIPNDPTKYCKDIHVCALQGPIISSKGSQTALEITAVGNNGETVATFKQGILSETANEPNNSVTPVILPAQVTGLRSDPTPPPWQDPVANSLFGLALLSGLGLVAGTPFSRRVLLGTISMLQFIKRILLGITRFRFWGKK